MNFYNHIVSTVTDFGGSIFRKELSSQCGTLAFHGILLYSHYQERLRKALHAVQKKYPAVHHSMYVAGYCFRFIKQVSLNRRIPPFYDTWFSISHIYFRMPEIDNIFDTVTLKCVLQEEFITTNASNHIIGEEMEGTMLQQWHKTATSLIQTNGFIYDGLISFQTPGAILYRICRPGVAFSEISFVASRVKFLTIEIYLPSHNTSYILHLTPDEYIVNNELFSPCFIKRYFEYHIGNHTFDINYDVKIMDSDICCMVLKKHQYIVLAEDTYSVKEI